MIKRYYIDTSVFGGYFDAEFEETTKRLFSQISKRGVKILYSELTKNELVNAPDRVKDFVNSIPVDGSAEK
jgi:predicted nucleic acid-binding protein